MLFSDWVNNKKKKEQEEQNNKLTSKIDKNYINNFFLDAQNFINSTEADYNGIKWSNASSVYKAKYNIWNDLNSRKHAISLWLDNNKDKLDKGTYSNLLSALDKCEKGSNTAVNVFKDASNYYSRFKTEEEYNDAKKQSELYSMSTEEILPHLDTSKTDAERSALVSKQQKIQQQIKDLGASGNKGKGAIKKTKLKNELREVNKQIEELGSTSNIAYTTLDGKDITWKSLYASKKREEEMQGLINNASKSKDFEEKSKYTSTKTDNLWDKLTAQYGMGYNDLTYEWINNIDGIRDRIENQHILWGNEGILSDNDSPWKEKAYGFMTEDEIKIYNYYYSTGGKEKAEEFLESLQETLYQREANERFGKYEGNTGLEILFGIESGLEQFRQGVKNAFNFSDDYIPYTDTQLMAGKVREDLEDDGFKIGNNSIAQIAFDSVQTTTNMLPSMALSFLPGGQALTAISVGLSASGNSYQDALNQGYDIAEARTYATLNGAAEAGLQYILGGIGKGAGKLTGKTMSSLTSNISKANLRIAANLGIRGLGEGLEEYLQAAVIEPVLSNAILGTNKEVDLLSEDALYSGFLGAITSIGLGTPSEIGSAIKTRSQGKEVIQKGEVGNLVKFGKSLSADTVAHKLANKVDENTGAYTIGLLLQEAGAESLSATNMADIEKSLVRKGVTEKDAKNISAWLNKAVEGGTFTKAQIAALENNEVISQTFKDVILNQNSTVNQRTRGYDSLLGLANEVATVPQAPTKEQISDNINASIAQKNAIRHEMAPKFGTDDLPSEVTETVNRMLAEKNKLSSDNTDIKTDFNVSEDGKTTNTSTGSKIKLAGIASIKDGVVMLKTEDGKTINSKNVSYASEEEGLIYESFVDFNPAFANAVIKNYDGKVPVQTYIKGMREGIVLYGMHNFQGVGKDISKDTFFAELSETDQAFALKLGRAYAESIAKKEGKALRTAIKNSAEKAEANKDTSSTNATAKKGKVSFESGVVAKGKLQKRTVSLAKHLARAIGVDIVFYDSRTTTNENGKGANGYFDEDTDTIYLDLQNSVNDAKTIAFTLSHELVHFIKKWSSEKFNTFAKFLMEQYAEHGVNTSTLLSNKMAELGTKDADLAYEEMIADACETMLLDSNAVYKLMELRKADLELFEKIKLHIHELLNKIRDMYKLLGLKPTSDEAKALIEMKDALEQIYSLFEEASVDAARNYQAASKAGVNKQSEDIKKQAKKRMTAEEKQLGIEFANFIEAVSNMLDHSNISKRKLKIGEISDIHKKTIENLMKTIYPNFSAEGYELWIDGTGAEHINIRHGKNGKADNSMASREDKELIPWVANSPDGGSFIREESGKLKLSNRFFNLDGSKAPQIRLHKIVDGDTIYVSECVPDSKLKRVYITSAYKKSNTNQLLNINSTESPQPTPKAIFDSGVTDDIITQENSESQGKNIKKQLKKDLSPYASTFYSLMGRVVDEMKQDKIGANSVIPYLKGRGVKDAEIKWSGIEDFLESKKSVTKGELQEFITGNMLQIEENMREERDAEIEIKKVSKNIAKVYADNELLSTFTKLKNGWWKSDKSEVLVAETYSEIEQIAARLIETNAKWSDRKLDGGKNYREITYKLPNSTYTNDAMKSHWGDNSKGILAHARIQDFYIDSRKMLFIEEIQSDWHNEGRKNGYFSKNNPKEHNKEREELSKKLSRITLKIGSELQINNFETTPKIEELRQQQRELKKKLEAFGDEDARVPDAPFKDNYHEYVLKSLIRTAAENGYDAIGWTPADVQSKRWSKDFAEGYRIEYDQDIPKFLTKYGKKWGAKVGSTVLNNGTEVWSMDITESMKQSVLYEGQVKFQNKQTRQESPNPYHGKTMYIDSDIYDYSFMTKLAPMKVETLPPLSAVKENGKVSQDKAVKMGLDNAKNIGRRVSADKEQYAIKNAYTQREIIIGKKGLKHSLDASEIHRLRTNARISAIGAYIVQNSVPINGLKKENQQANGTYAMACLVNDGHGYVVAIVTVDEFDSTVVGIDVVDSVHSVNGRFLAKKEDSRSSTRESELGQESFSATAISTINIADFLKIVNSTHRSILSNNVLSHFDLERPSNGYYSQRVLFQKKKPTNRELLSNALESTIDTSTQAGQNELKWLKEYQSKINTIEKEEAHLDKVNAEIKKLSFSKDTDRSKLKDLRLDKVMTSNRIHTYDKQLMRLEAMKPIKDILAREKDLVRKRTEEKGREALAEYRKEAIKVRNRMIGEARKETRQKISESRNRTEMRHKIKKVVSELNQLLLKGTKDKHVMVGLQKAVAEALDAVNMDTVDAENRIAKYNALIAKASDPDVIASLTETRDRIQATGDRMSSKITTLKNAYGEIKNSTDPLIANSYDDVIASSIENVVEKVGDTPLRAMSIVQLEDVYDLYKMVLTRIRDANKTFKSNKGESISALGNKVMMEIKKVGGSKTHVLGGKLGAALSLVKKFDFNNMKPVYIFERIGSSTLSQMFENVRKGEDVWAVDITEAKDFKDKTTSKYNYKKWDFDKVYSFETSTGNKFSLTLEQIMSLYAYSKREQALPHLAKGGFVFDSNIETHKENDSGKKSVLKYRVNTATAHKVSPFEVADIVSKLSADQKAFVDEMQNYLSGVMGAKGNEVALEMYGVKLFKEKHYFPLKSAKQYMFEQNNVAGEVKIKNSGFSKSTVKYANNPVILSNFMDVWANHVNDMSMYHAFVLPLEDFNRVFNYNTPASQSLDEESVKGFIQNAYGTQANEYISQLIKDLNGGARVDPRESFSKNMIGKFKKASVFGSASVVIQQPSAVGRALALIDAKYFDFNPKIISHNKLWAEVKKYAPIAIIKEMGYFDTDMSKSTVDYIKSEKSLMGKIDNFISKPASYMDELTWVHIWTAVKREVKANNKGLSGDAYLKKCGERFTEVVTKTQVYDSVLSRSANMRSKSVFMNMLTSFMAEPTTSINMLEDAITKFNRGHKGKASRQIASVAASVILNSMLVAFVYAARDDDEDETYWEKYIGSLTAEIIDGSNPITYYPILKDIWSVAQGYDVERSDMTLVSKAIDSLKNVTTVMLTNTEDMTEEELAEHNQKIVAAWIGVTGEFSSLLGIPAKNLIRDIKAGFNVYDTANNGAEGSWSLLWDAVAESAIDTVPIVGWFDNESKNDKLYDAIISGDTSVVNRLKWGYKDDKAYNTAVRKALRENDPRIKEAAEARFNGDMTRYKELAYKIKGEGHFTQDNIVAAIMTEFNILKSASSNETSSSESPSLYNYADYYNAIINGDTNDIAMVKNYLIESGKTEKNIESNLNSNVKDAYEKGELVESVAKALMVSYGGKTKNEADISIRYVDFKAEYPDYKDVITEARFANYYEPIKDYYGRSIADTGLSISAYAEYCEKSARCTGTDANGDGKVDSGSKKAEVMRIINGLPISSAQKDALYYLNGWAKSKLYEAPWH